MSIGILIQWFFPPQNCSGTKNKQTNKNRGEGGGGRERVIHAKVLYWAPFGTPTGALCMLSIPLHFICLPLVRCIHICKSTNYIPYLSMPDPKWPNTCFTLTHTLHFSTHPYRYMIEFKTMASSTWRLPFSITPKSPMVSFRYRRKLNPGPLFKGKRLQ